MPRPHPRSTLFPYTTLFRSGRHDTSHLATGVEAESASKPYEFGDTINLDVNTTLLSAIQREGLTVPLNLDRKSTRLNSSHSQISYAVFCLKKKTEKPKCRHPHTTPFYYIPFISNATPTPEIYTLSLHDALPIWQA